MARLHLRACIQHGHPLSIKRQRSIAKSTAGCWNCLHIMECAPISALSERTDPVCLSATLACLGSLAIVGKFGAQDV